MMRIPRRECISDAPSAIGDNISEPDGIFGPRDERQHDTRRRYRMSRRISLSARHWSKAAFPPGAARPSPLVHGARTAERRLPAVRSKSVDLGFRSASQASSLVLLGTLPERPSQEHHEMSYAALPRGGPHAAFPAPVCESASLPLLPPLQLECSYLVLLVHTPTRILRR